MKKKKIAIVALIIVILLVASFILLVIVRRPTDFAIPSYSLDREIIGYPITELAINFESYNLTKQIDEAGFSVNAENESTLVVLNFTVRNLENKPISLLDNQRASELKTVELPTLYSGYYRNYTFYGTYQKERADNETWINHFVDESIRTSGYLMANQTAKGLLIYNVPRENQPRELQLYPTKSIDYQFSVFLSYVNPTPSPTPTDARVDPSWIANVTLLLEQAKPYPIIDDNETIANYLLERANIFLRENATNRIVTKPDNNTFVSYLERLLLLANYEKNSSIPSGFAQVIPTIDTAVVLEYRFPENIGLKNNVLSACFILEDKMGYGLKGTIILRQAINGQYNYSIWAIEKT